MAAEKRCLADSMLTFRGRFSFQCFNGAVDDSVCHIKVPQMGRFDMVSSKRTIEAVRTIIELRPGSVFGDALVQIEERGRQRGPGRSHLRSIGTLGLKKLAEDVKLIRTGRAGHGETESVADLIWQ